MTIRRPPTLSRRQINTRLSDLRWRLVRAKRPETRAKLLADYVGFSSRVR